MKHPIRRRFMYLGFQGLRLFAQSLPSGLSRTLGQVLGTLAFWLLAGQRRLALQHLSLALGESVSPAERRRIAQGVFRNLGQNIVEWFRLSRDSNDRIQELVSAEGVEYVRRALGKGNGAILLTAHFGNWELIPLYLRSLGFEGGVVARRLRYPEYESFLINLRGARGISTYARGSVKEVAKVLRANQIVGMLPDQDIDSLEGTFVDLFGHPAYTPLGPAALSLMTSAPIIPCFIIRESGGRFRLVIEPPLEAPQVQDRSQALSQLTQAWSRVVESYIRRHPDHWVWMHRRWKTQSKNAQGSGLRAGTFNPEPRAQNPESAVPRTQLALSLLLLGISSLALACISGCSKPKQAHVESVTTNLDATEQMSGFLLTGYETDGSKRWELKGNGASMEDQIVTIHHPDGIGYDLARTAYLTATAAQINQQNRHVRMEHDVTIHTEDGLWLFTPVLHWMPDQNQVATDHPVRIETDHMLLRGRGASGLTQLKQVKVLTDVEMVLNPSEDELPAGGAKQVIITCDGPLTFNYERNVATFEQNVHVKDPNGDLYSDKLIAYLNETTRTIRYAEAIGKVRIHQQQNTALSEKAVYEPALGKMTLVGKPSLLIYPSEEQGSSSQLSLGGLAPEPMHQ